MMMHLLAMPSSEHGQKTPLTIVKMAAGQEEAHLDEEEVVAAAKEGDEEEVEVDLEEVDEADEAGAADSKDEAEEEDQAVNRLTRLILGFIDL
jgi:hypothetical protein